MSALQNFVGLDEVSKTLLIWGGKDFAKSGGLIAQADAWRKQGYVVVDINFKGADVTSEETLARHIRRSLLKTKDLLPLLDKHFEVPELRLGRRDTRKIKKGALYITAAAILGAGAFVYPFVAASAGSVFAALTAADAFRSTGAAVDDFVGAFERAAVDLPSHYPELLDAFTVIGKNLKEKEKKLILIIREVQALPRGTGPGDALQQHLLLPLLKIKETLPLHFYPILETSDSNWVLQHSEKEASTLETYQVLPFREDELLSDPAFSKEFTESETRRIFQATQGHPGSVYSIHERLNRDTLGKKNPKLEDAIKYVQDEVTRRTELHLIKLLNTHPKELGVFEVILKTLLRTPISTQKLPGAEEKVLQLLTGRNIVFNDGKFYDLQNHLIKTAINGLLEANVLKF